jgi:hypothetical protein
LKGREKWSDGKRGANSNSWKAQIHANGQAFTLDRRSVGFDYAKMAIMAMTTSNSIKVKPWALARLLEALRFIGKPGKKWTLS